MAVLFTFGANDRSSAIVGPDNKGQMKIFVSGSSNVLGMVNIGRIKPIPYMIYGPNAEQPPLRLPEKPTMIFNQISEPESHGVALERCIELCDRLDVPVINHPRIVQRNSRDKVARLLSDIPGAIIPKTVLCAPKSPAGVFQAAQENGISFPFIFRSTGEHNGHNMILIKNADEIDRLHAFPFDGRDFFLIEFVEYAEPNGIYRKHRIVFIDGDIFPHHSSFHERWKVHVSAGNGIAFMASRPELGSALENLTHLEENLFPKARPVLREINRRIELDYFAIDCHIFEDGQVLVFEANANVNAMENALEGVAHLHERMRSRMSRMISDRSGEAL